MLERRNFIPRKAQGFEICFNCKKHIKKGAIYYNINATYSNVKNADGQRQTKTYTKNACVHCRFDIYGTE